MEYCLWIVCIAIIVILIIVMRISFKVEFVSNIPIQEISTECKEHYHSFWHFIWPKGDWFPKLERMTHVWTCTSEKCPADKEDCQRGGHWA